MIEHKHLIVRASVQQPPMQEEKVSKWIVGLVNSVGMTLLDVGDQTNPVVAYCNKNGNRGMTAAALIDTSHIVLHTWDEDDPAIIQLDVYTCSDLDVGKVLDTFCVFEPIKYSYFVLDRKDMLSVEYHGDWIDTETIKIN